MGLARKLESDSTVEPDKHDEKVTEQQVEVLTLSPAQIQHRFDTLRDLSDEQMTALNKQVLRKIDWRLMPCISLMFFMR